MASVECFLLFRKNNKPEMSFRSDNLQQQQPLTASHRSGSSDEYWIIVASTLAKRLRRWANVDTTIIKQHTTSQYDTRHYAYGIATVFQYQDDKEGKCEPNLDLLSFLTCLFNSRHFKTN